MSEDIPYFNADAKDGRTFKGVCDLCNEEIYSGYDHDERCIYYDG